MVTCRNSTIVHGRKCTCSKSLRSVSLMFPNDSIILPPPFFFRIARVDTWKVGGFCFWDSGRNQQTEHGGAGKYGKHAYPLRTELQKKAELALSGKNRCHHLLHYHCQVGERPWSHFLPVPPVPAAVALKPLSASATCACCSGLEASSCAGPVCCLHHMIFASFWLNVGL